MLSLSGFQLYSRWVLLTQHAQNHAIPRIFWGGKSPSVKLWGEALRDDTKNGW